MAIAGQKPQTKSTCVISKGDNSLNIKHYYSIDIAENSLEFQQIELITKNCVQFSWKSCFQRKNRTYFNTYHATGKFSRWQTDDIFVIFPRKQDLTFYANCFLGKVRKIFQYVVCRKFYPECKALRCCVLISNEARLMIKRYYIYVSKIAKDECVIVYIRFSYI